MSMAMLRMGTQGLSQGLPFNMTMGLVLSGTGAQTAYGSLLDIGIIVPTSFGGAQIVQVATPLSNSIQLKLAGNGLAQDFIRSLRFVPGPGNAVPGFTAKSDNLFAFDPNASAGGLPVTFWQWQAAQVEGTANFGVPDSIGILYIEG